MNRDTESAITRSLIESSFSSVLILKSVCHKNCAIGHCCHKKSINCLINQLMLTLTTLLLPWSVLNCSETSCILFSMSKTKNMISVKLKITIKTWAVALFLGNNTNEQKGSIKLTV